MTSTVHRLRPAKADAATVQARQQVADDMAGALFSLEDGVEEALGRSAMLIHTVVTERQRLKLSVFHGQPIVEEALSLASTLAEARARSARLHRAMDLTQRQVGVQVMTNPGDKPDQGADFMPQASATPLPEVASA